MRAKGPIRVLILLLAVSLLPMALVRATHEPRAQDVAAVAEASPWLMQCDPASGQQVCIDLSRIHASRRATIVPGAGPLESVMTHVNGTVNGGYYMFAEDQDWNAALHGVGCDAPNGVGAFMAELGKDSPGPKTLGPTVVGECSMTGRLFVPIDQAPYYDITSTVLASAFSPTPSPTTKPTPTPTPKPTQTPTPTPTPTPTVKPPTPTPRPTLQPGATATATPISTTKATAQPIAHGTATSTATASASESTSASASATATASASASAEQTVAGITFTPEPSSAPPAPAGGGNDWAGSVPSASEVSTDAADIGGSILVALLLLLAMGFIGELFNNTMDTNYDRILGWWQKTWVGRIGRAFSGMWGGGSQ
ncbi:MAG: hypothetical protein M3P32_08450 [Chloroflexota bacterium]|nr:hypothetical protein [Chloroflexota bacterium]